MQHNSQNKELHGLTEKQIQIIIGIFSAFSDKINVVKIFGSRANGNFRENSDLDLVVYGTITDKELDRLWTLFNESALPFSVDIKTYSQINYSPLKEHIDKASIDFLRVSFKL